MLSQVIAIGLLLSRCPGDRIEAVLNGIVQSVFEAQLFPRLLERTVGNDFSVHSPSASVPEVRRNGSLCLFLLHTISDALLDLPLPYITGLLVPVRLHLFQEQRPLPVGVLPHIEADMDDQVRVIGVVLAGKLPLLSTLRSGGIICSCVVDGFLLCLKAREPANRLTLGIEHFVVIDALEGRSVYLCRPSFCAARLGRRQNKHLPIVLFDATQHPRSPWAELGEAPCVRVLPGIAPPVSHLSFGDCKVIGRPASETRVAPGYIHTVPREPFDVSHTLVSGNNPAVLAGLLHPGPRLLRGIGTALSDLYTRLVLCQELHHLFFGDAVITGKESLKACLSQLLGLDALCLLDAVQQILGRHSLEVYILDRATQG